MKQALDLSNNSNPYELNNNGVAKYSMYKYVCYSVLIPIALTVIVIWTAYSSHDDTSNLISIQHSATTSSTINSICYEDIDKKYFDFNYCTDTSVPVCNGIDFVQYFTEFKLSTGMYNESRVGTLGSSSYQYVYNGYTFLFKSEENQKLFQESPESYIPQVS